MSNNEQTTDLFSHEQIVFDHAVKYSSNLRCGQDFNTEEYHSLVKEYGAILRQLRRLTRLYDRTADSLNKSKLDLLGKVHYDPLTGIYNRLYLEDNLERIIKSEFPSCDILSVMMLDVDFFKRYNDTYGHSEGDECLKRIAKTIAESLAAPDDFAARYGGEEFIAVLPGTDESSARVTANRILRNMREMNIPHEKNEAADCVTISIGVTTAKIDHAQTGEDYIKRADAALYVSKNKGRNRYTFIDFHDEK